MVTAYTKMTPFEHSQLDELAAFMIYDAGLPLSFFEHPSVKAFLKRLQPAYTPPTRLRLSGTLLEKSYEATKTEVEDYINTQQLLSVSFDESNNVSSDRIMNIALTTPRGAFYYENIVLGSATVSAEFCAEKIEQRLQHITKQRMRRVNSISTDTCDTMLKTARLLRALPSLKHTFMVPCDPHGLQLLIQDICKFTWFTKVVRQANEIVAHFKGSKKQYQVLKELQRRIYGGKALALIMACDVRWGTYSGEFKRLLDVSKALKAWATDHCIISEEKPSERAQQVVKSISSHLFWLQLSELEEIITPIHIHQLEAQTDRSHIGYVRGRWDKIWQHLERCQKTSSSISWDQYWPVLEARKKRQLVDLHTLAYWLMPANVLSSRFKSGTSSNQLLI